MPATNNSNKSETLFWGQSHFREELWAEWRMSERDDFDGSENFMRDGCGGDLNERLGELRKWGRRKVAWKHGCYYSARIN